MIYKPTDEALRNPRRAFIKNFGWVGIGGDIEIKNTPPKLPSTIIIPECTQEQYEYFFNSGLTALIYVVASIESNTGKRKRRETSHSSI